MGYGDELMAAGQAERVFREGDGRRVAICDHAGRPRWHELWEHNPIIVTPEESRREPYLIAQNGRFCRPYIRYPFTRDSGWRYNRAWRARDHRGKLYLTEAEEAKGWELREQLGPFVYIEPSLAADTTRNKDWGFKRYAQLVARCRDLTFVRAIHADTRSLSSRVLELQGLSFREVAGILKYAAAYVGPEGGLHHVAAALQTPAVVVWGGCVDVEVLGYPEQTNLVDTGPDSPCGRYLPCNHCAAAMGRISVRRVTTSLRQRVQTPQQTPTSVP